MNPYEPSSEPVTRSAVSRVGSLLVVIALSVGCFMFGVMYGYRWGQADGLRVGGFELNPQGVPVPMEGHERNPLGNPR